MNKQNNKNIEEIYLRFEDLEKFVENRKINELTQSIRDIQDLKEELKRFNNRSFFKRSEFFCCLIIFVFVIILFIIIFILIK